MKILFWVPYPVEGASNRYRVQQYLPSLKEAGIIFSVRPFWSSEAYSILYKKGFYLRKAFFFILGVISRITDMMRISYFDLVFIHRESLPVGPDILESLLYLLRKPMIFDFDDAIFLPASSQQNYFIERFKNPAKVPRIIKKSRQVIAGNSYLGDFALQFNSAVTVIPTSIDTDTYRRPSRSQKPCGAVTIGWMGSTTTAWFLKDMDSVFKALAARFPGLRFLVVGGKFYVPGVNIENRPWRMEEELSDLSSIDIGIMPMPDNQWTRGKCGFKAILYMSMGIPCVCSPVGMNREIVAEGVNGFLASTQKEWVDKLSRLAEEPDLRAKIGESGRQTVEQRYSVKANSRKLIKVINNIHKIKG